ncbi:MAG: pyrroline-5-carboxylate reductase, partial [Firmicutes bacterium]|nr:pyrroline-5-carboxylate reductase [Bacillota bacterium]
IGCGNMAYALLRGICRNEELAPERIFVNDLSESRLHLFENEFKAISADKADLISAADMVILGVKPNQIREVLENTKDSWQEEKILLSIAAGIRTGFLESLLSPNVVRVIRAMPNTPCLAGEGMTGLCGGRTATTADMEKVRSLFAASGRAITVKEQDMDAVVAVSGSGPAYVFLIIEAMIEAAVSVGLNSATARELVLQTVKGSVAMLEETGQHPAILKQQVTSPGGTTIAALRQLEEGGLRRAFFDAIEAARNRSIELG